MSKTSSEKIPPVVSLWRTAAGYVVARWRILVVFFVAFAAAVAVVYLDASTTDTVASYMVEDYEVGQVADRTIYATKSMSADELFPVAIEEGEKVIRKGFPITEEDYLKLRKMAVSPAYIDYRAFADCVLFLLLVAAFWFVLFSPGLLGRHAELKEIVLEAVLFIVVFAVAAFAGKSPVFQTAYRLPVAVPSVLCVFLVAILFGQTSALYFSLLLGFGVLAAAHFQLVPMLFTIASCLCAARIVRHIERRIDLVFASIMLAVLNVVFMAMCKVMFNDTFSDAPFVMLGVAFNGFISGILVLGLLTPLESLLNTASVFRLMDLSDLNTPVMRKMLLTASGTYNHSMLVASLAENACKTIGANALLARVGAYYHDLGKMDQPEYFVENQGGGGNKHDDINPSLSASIIRSHVKRGVEKAHQLRLPKRIVDIISEHHGNSVMAYFYNEAKQKDPNVSPESFAYTGNPPSSVESAVVMIADTVEAACRTLDKPSVPRLDKFIQTLIQSKIDHHQLDNCPLTFGDLTKIRESFVQILAGYYHSRIEYPNQKDPGEEKPGEATGEKSAEGDKEKPAVPVGEKPAEDGEA